MTNLTANEIIKLLEAELEEVKKNRSAKTNALAYYAIGFCAELEQAIDIVKQTDHHLKGGGDE